MTVNPWIETVRKLVRDRFANQLEGDTEEFCESILVREGVYCGRRFSQGGLEAVWFAEENQLKLYDQQGRLMEVVRPELPQRDLAA